MGITVGKKKLKNGRFSLFLDITMSGRRWKEYLGIKLEKASSDAIQKENRMKLQIADQLRLQREVVLWGPSVYKGHSFITNIMIGGANIKTASSLAGHSTIRHTEKYVHVIDTLKQQAVDSLPQIKLTVDL